jgi:hypothetical protein
MFPVANGREPAPGRAAHRRARASTATLTGFLDLCGSAPTTACAFSAGSPAATRAKFATLLSRLRQHPVTIGTQTYTYASTATGLPLGVVTNWQTGANRLAELWTATTTDPHPWTAAGPATGQRGTSSLNSSQEASYSGQEQELGEFCSDSPNPSDPQAYPGFAALSYAQSVPFGPYYTWMAEECAQWPTAAAQDRYTGPWNRPTAGTILLVGNTGDPNTPYQDSVALSRELGNARLLTVDGYGHTEASNDSTCADNYLINYALTGALPPAGSVCKENATPFP